MKQFTTKLLAFCALLAVATGMQAQVFYTQNFSGAGLPAGWTTADPSVNNVLWVRCTDTVTNCITNAGDYAARLPYAGVDKNNGFMVLDSDAPGDLAAPHISQLTTAAINCTGKSAVFALFENYIGVFDYDADDNAILRVSTDLTNWVDFQIFEGITGGAQTRFSANPFEAGIDISGVAANQATVYLQWQFTGDYEYWWMLDNVRLTTEDPSPRNNLVVSDFFYPVSSYATPATQLPDDVFGFSASISNEGSLDQTNVKVYASVVEITGGVIGDYLYTDSLTLDVLPAGYVDSLVEFTNQYTPALPEGLYAVIYEVVSDSVDQRPLDNLDGDFFEATDLIFAKENNPTTAYRPNPLDDWGTGNLYTMGSATLEKYKAVGAEFAFATNVAELPVTDVEGNVNLYKINDDVDPDLGNFADDGSSLELLATAAYSAPDDIVDFDLQTVELVDVVSAEIGVELVPNGRYVLTMEYANANNQTFHAYNEETIAPFYSTFVVVGGVWNIAGFQGTPNAVMRLYLNLLTKTDDKPLPETALSVSPNPTADFVNLKVQFDQPTDATITIADINGRVVRTENRSGMTQELVTYQLPELASGTYLARIATKEGTRTLKFVVQK